MVRMFVECPLLKPNSKCEVSSLSRKTRGHYRCAGSCWQQWSAEQCAFLHWKLGSVAKVWATWHQRVCGGRSTTRHRRQYIYIGQPDWCHEENCQWRHQRTLVRLTSSVTNLEQTVLTTLSTMSTRLENINAFIATLSATMDKVRRPPVKSTAEAKKRTVPQISSRVAVTLYSSWLDYMWKLPIWCGSVVFLRKAELAWSWINCVQFGIAGLS